MCRRDGRPSPACWRRRHLAAAHMGLAEQRHWGLKPPRKELEGQLTVVSTPNNTLRRVGDLEAEALIPAGAAGNPAALTRRYALAITPQTLPPIHRPDPHHPLARPVLPRPPPPN